MTDKDTLSIRTALINYIADLDVEIGNVEAEVDQDPDLITTLCMMRHIRSELTYLLESSV
jgi:hypothetical protein